LLEYAFWPGSQEANPLIVVGETALDEEGTVYLRKLKKRFSLPIEYEQIVV
jgi:CO dehydrogenase/acetyl-CoA synthase epsilon subunit